MPFDGVRPWCTARRRRAPGSSGVTPNARQVAYRCLQRIDHEGAYANLLLQGELGRSRLSERDRGFVTELVYGTTRMRRACDALIDRFLIKEPQPSLRTLLRLGAYQVHFAGVAAHAAVGETVELAPKPARGFVNAILRRVADTPMEWASEAVRLSYPDWIVARLRKELGDEADADAGADERAGSRVGSCTTGTGRTSRRNGSLPRSRRRLAKRSSTCAPHPVASRRQWRPSGADVIAADLQLHRARLIRGVPVLVADAVAPPFRPASFDKVLVDAPCSGLGALRRRADARWRITESDVSELAELQRKILSATAPLVRPGGSLTYSVCTLTAEESIDHPVPAGFDPITDSPGPQWRPYAHGWRVLAARP